MIRADVLFVKGSVILKGLPSKVLIKASSGGGEKSYADEVTFDIIILPALSKRYTSSILLSNLCAAKKFKNWLGLS